MPCWLLALAPVTGAVGDADAFLLARCGCDLALAAGVLHKMLALECKSKEFKPNYDPEW